ncbi:MAG: hypothetical protein KJZ64_04390 [Sphingomonadaceae bacterium]|nr:hypothetical protein [Sphingomonadaceae bacterium]
MHIEQAKFIAEASARYHRRRAMFLERLSSVLNLINIICGTTAFFVVISNFENLVKALALFIALSNCLQMIFKIEESATMHKVWLSRWHDCLEIIESKNTLGSRELAQFVKIRNSIERECVGEMHALKVDCFNRTAHAMKFDTSSLKRLGIHHKVFMHILPFENSLSD